MQLISYCLFLILLYLAWQDFKYRAVYWWLFPLLLLTLIWVKNNGQYGLDLNDVWYNVLFVVLQLLFLTLYFSIKERRWVNLFKSYFGLGDLLFLLCITVYFSFLNYVLFYVASLFIIILITVFTQLFAKKADHKIPLAGWQAILLLAMVLLQKFNSKINLTTDLALLNYLG